jgi:hypothetical protein
LRRVDGKWRWHPETTSGKARAQKILNERYLSIPEDEMLLRLRLLVKRKGRLCANIINEAAGVPSAMSYIKHFGSLRKAFERIGYKSPRDCDWLDPRSHWNEVAVAHARHITAALAAGRSSSGTWGPPSL